MIRSADSRYAHPCLLAVAILCLAIGAGMSATAQTDENWSPDFGLAGTDGEVICSVVWNGNLVVAGNFGVAGVSDVGGVALWDGSQWSAMGGGLEYSVGALAVWNGDLYAGGNFGESGGVTLNGLARWNGTSWEDVGGGVGGGVMALLATPGDVYKRQTLLNGRLLVTPAPLCAGDILQLGAGGPRLEFQIEIAPIAAAST